MQAGTMIRTALSGDPWLSYSRRTSSTVPRCLVIMVFLCSHWRSDIHRYSRGRRTIGETRAMKVLQMARVRSEMPGGVAAKWLCSVIQGKRGLGRMRPQLESIRLCICTVKGVMRCIFFGTKSRRMTCVVHIAESSCRDEPATRN